MAEVSSLRGVDLDDGEQPRGHRRRGHEQPSRGARGAALHEHVERRGRRDLERAHPRAPQTGEVPADAEPGAEIAGQGANIGARRAVDAGIQFNARAFGSVDATHREHLEGTNRHPACGELDLLARANPVVGAAAVDLDGADRARPLVDLAGEGTDARSEFVIGHRRDCRRVGDTHDLSLGVVGRGRDPQPDGRLVGLVEAHQVGEQSRGRAGSEREQARRHGVEGAGMADLASVEGAACTGDDVVAGEPAGFVDEEHPGGHGIHASAARPAREPRLAGMRIAVIGAGAVGGLMAALAARAGHEVLVSARGEHAAAIARAGLHVDGGWGEGVAHVELVRSIPSEALDLLVLATKAHDSADALSAWTAHDGTAVLVLQNGLGGEDAVRDAFPHSPVAIGLALFAVSLASPGRITVTGPNGLTLGGEPAAVAVAEPLLRTVLPDDGSAELVLTDDIHGARWTKLLVNQVNALPAITGLSVQQTVADPALREVLARGMVETVAVGDALGVRWGRIGAVDADAVARVRAGGTAAAADLAQALAHGMGDVPNPASMLQSIRRGRTTEVDAINGAIAALGAQHGVPTPVNAALVELVHGVEGASAGTCFLATADVVARVAPDAKA